MTQTIQPEVQKENTARHARQRCGGCSRRVSAVRPVSSSYPAQFQGHDAAPKGFLLFGGRGSAGTEM